MSLKAYRLLKNVDVIVGYKRYVELIDELLSEEQEVYTTGMRGEVERAKKAIELTRGGRRVAVISSGDPGVYGMAGLVLELINKEGREIPIEILPGITAANAAASSLGAPLMHDYAVISLSDLLTPWPVIEKRLKKAAEGDFIVALYNPGSKKRVDQIKKARKIFLQYKEPATPVGIVRRAKRGKEEVVITNLEQMLEHRIDMFTTVIIGNSNTFTTEDLMITPRGYRI